MYGDHSRGHEPDRKRGRSYRRVLLQMGRPVLDSDLASLVDAVLGEVRSTARATAGSPDLGLLVTPGRLLTVFSEVHDRLEVLEGAPNAWLDYRFRLADRYPALHLAAPGAKARVKVPLLQRFDPSTSSTAGWSLWARVEKATSIRVNGAEVSLTAMDPDSPAFQAPQRVPIAGGSAAQNSVDIELPAAGEVWLFLLEEDEKAGSAPRFWVAPGSYHLDGLVSSSRGGPFPHVTFPERDGFDWTSSSPPLGGLIAPGMASGTRLVAYVEAWERSVTAVEDPGIREEALGSADTSTRTELVTQVKVATVQGELAGSPTPGEALRAAFGRRPTALPQLTIAAREADPTSNPCAVADVAGYTGGNNHLYRVEVHRGGGLVQVQLKWSRDNGSDLFEAQVRDGNLVFEAGTPLRGGDLVEVLDNVVDLGDQALAAVSKQGFSPAARAVGRLVSLEPVGVQDARDEVVFRPVEPQGSPTPVTLDSHYAVGEAVTKVRRWDGIVDPKRLAGDATPSPGPHPLEEGLAVTLHDVGEYRPGQWWQYEARVAANVANGAWPAEPHGPEQVFAPLALVEYAGANEPLRLVTWLDERFSPPTEVEADDIAFGGDRVGSASTTVQEAIEELFERPIHESSCTVTVAPGMDLEEELAKLPEDGGQLCFEAGIYELKAPLVFAGAKHLVVHGAGSATVLRAKNTEAALVFRGCTDVAVRGLRAEGAVASPPKADPARMENGAISFVGGGEVTVSDCTLSCPDAAPNSQGYVHRTQACLTARGGSQQLRVRVEDSRMEVGSMQTGALLVDAAHAFVSGNTIRVSGATTLISARCADQGIVASGTTLGTIEVLDNVIEQTIQGIHIAGAGPAREVILSRNVVHARVPTTYTRERHAVFVADVTSLHIQDTLATLERTGTGSPTPVDGIRLVGGFGPFLSVRQSSLKGFLAGVRVQPLEAAPTTRLWLVSETMAVGAELGAEVPETVQTERNYPERRKVASLLLAPLDATVGQGREHTITATARDVYGRPVKGVAIHYSVSGTNTVGDQSVRTDAAGMADLKYTGQKAGQDTVIVYADSNDNGRQDADEALIYATVRITQEPSEVQLSLNRDPSPRGSSTVVTATVKAVDGSNLPNQAVVFSVSGANVREAKSVVTNASGQAIFSYTGQKAGAETVHAVVNENVTADIGHTYNAEVAGTITLLPASGVAFAEDRVTFSATVRDAAGVVFEGVPVTFRVMRNGSILGGGVVSTSDGGVAVYSYTGTEGQDLILALVDNVNEPKLQASSIQTFRRREPDRVMKTVPAVLGMTQAAAETTIGNAGLVPVFDGLLTAPARPGPSYLWILGPALVVEQTPAPNTEAVAGSSVRFKTQRRWEQTDYEFERYPHKYLTYAPRLEL